MDNFNFRNMQLAYQAVHDEVLCESMDELGFFDPPDEIEEGYKKLPVGKMMRQAARKPVKAAAEIEARGPRSLGVMVAGEPNWKIKRALRQAAKMARVAERHSTIKGTGRVRGEGQAELNRRKGEMKEDYDLFEIVLEHLIDEGYTDTVEGAVSILENMSDEWLDVIVEGKKAISDRQVRAMSKRARNLAFNAASETHSDETGIGIVPRGDNTARQLRTLARVGGKKVKGHIKRGYEQGRNYDPYYQELNSRDPSRNRDYDG